MEGEQRSNRAAGIEDRFARYDVYDRDGDKIGKVDVLFVDENDRPEYVGVKMGFLGNRSTLIPMQIVSIHEGRQALEVDYSRGVIEDGRPSTTRKL